MADASMLQILATMAYIALLVFVLRRTPLTQLRQNRYQHLLFGACAALCTLWIFRAGIYDGLSVHFLWLPALTLTLGFRWSMLIAGVALIVSTLLGQESLSMLGVNGLLGICVPIAITYGIYSLSFHRLPRHVFVYIFVCAFFAGALSIASKMLLLGSYYTLEGIHSWDTVKDNYLILIPLLLFPEGMLNGMTMTLLVIYKPEWVYTFYDKFYLDEQDKE